MKHFIITKYNPARRDKNRVYLDAMSEWSEACEIGKVFNGNVFTLQDYLATENGYIDTILAFFDASGLHHLRMTTPPSEVLNSAENLQEFREEYPDLYESEFGGITFKNDKKVCRNELAVLIKMNLRGVANCTLGVDDAFYLNFSWDSYVYIECEFVPKLSQLTPQIYAEEMPTPGPYFPRGEIEVLVEKIELGKDIVTEGDLTILASFSRREIRDLLGYSKEFPFVTYTKITPEVYGKIKHLTDYAFDFEQYEYSLNTHGNDD